MNVAKRLVLLLSLWMSSVLLVAQQGIQLGEYFWDADPGVGSALPVAVPNGNWDVWLSQLLVSNNGIPTNGTHTLSVRLMDGEGVWGPAYKRVINFSAAVRVCKITAAEFFINSDPGQGNGVPLLAFDNNFNAAFETVLLSNYSWPTVLGNYSLGIRIKDESGVWGPVFTKTFAVKNDVRDIKITAAEFFWDTDPGEGNGQVILAIDGNFNQAYEQLLKNNATYPTAGDVHVFGLRVQDELGVWGPVYRRVVKADQNIRDIKITAGEIFWNNDPGQGNGIAVLAYDNGYADALEQIILSSNSGLPTVGGAHLFNIRFKDENNVWGPVFKRVITRQQSARDIKVSLAEYFWDNDPGQGQASPLIAFDGNYNSALESVFQSVNLPEGDGMHVFHIRVKDESGIWGPIYKKTVRRGNESRLASLTMAEYFWGVNDPGPGSGSALVVFDGQFNQALESLLGYEIPAPSTGTQLFNLRVQDESGNWGPVYRRSISVGEPLNLYITSYNDITSICQGDSLHLFAHGGSNYLWSPLASIVTNNGNDVWVKPTSNTTFKVKALVEGVWDSAYFEILVNPNPVLQVNNPFIELGSFATLNVSGANSYTWTPTVNPLNLAGSSVSVAPSENTVYTVVGLNTNTGCSATATALVSISEPPYSSYPYPTNQNLTFGEYFWDEDPGIGNAQAIEVLDGNWNGWLETMLLNTSTIPNDFGLHSLNVRVRDRVGNWGPTYRRILRTEDFNLRSLSITAAEYFWDTDPGLGMAQAILAFDGNYNSAIESAYVSDSSFGNLPTSQSIHTFNIRVKDDQGLWGPLYSKAITFGQTTRLAFVSGGEYFWDNDPGFGQAIPVIAFDGNFQGALEQIAASTPTLPSQPGGHVFNIRVKDETGLWSNTYKRSVFVIQQVRNMKISLAEYFWDTDPGEGQAISLLAVDGNYNRALEQVWTSAATTPSTIGEHVFGIRIRDENNVWGPVYKRIMRIGNDSRLCNITTAEYFWDEDPGQGNGSTVLVFDGNYNAAFENLFNNSVSIPSPFEKHTFNIRVRDEQGVWGPLFKRVVQTGEALRDIRITAGEYFWGEQDPGEGSGVAIIAYDGNFNKALEYLFTNEIETVDMGVQLFNIRVSDDQNVWGPLYRRVINVGVPPILIEVISNQENNAVCQGESIQFSANGASYFSWYNAAGEFLASGATYGFTPSNDTSLMVVGVDGDLMDTVVLNVTVYSLPNVSIQASQLTTCQGGQVTLTASGANAYVWTPANTLNIGYGSVVLANPTQNTTYTVVGTVTNSGCTASNTISILTTPAITPTATITASSTVTCPGGQVVFTATVQNGGSNPQYQWRLNGININGATAATYTTSTLSNGNVVSCLVVPNNVCQSANSIVTNGITITVTNQPITPTIAISASANNVCAGSEVSFSAVVTNAGSNPSYQWKVNGVVQGTQATFTSNALINGDVVLCTLTASGNCLTTNVVTSNTIVMVVSGVTVPSIVISPSNNPVCSTSAVVLTSNSTNGAVVGYQWKKNGTVLAGSNGSSLVVSAPVNGDVYQCQLTAVNACGNSVVVNSNNITLTVTLPLVPSVAISQSSAVVCSGGSATFTAQGVNLGTNPTYQWSLNGQVVNGYNSSTFTYGPFQNGDLIQCNAFANNACQTSGNVLSPAIAISTTATLQPSVSIATTQNTICSGSNATVTASPVNGGSAPVYTWKVNGVNINGQSGPVFNYGSLVNGDNVTVQMTANNLCQTANNVVSNTVTYTILPNIVPTIQIVADNNTACQGQNVLLSASATNFGSSPAYQWRKNGVNIPGANGLSYSANNLVNGDVLSCVLFANNTCQSSNAVTSNLVQMTITPLVTPSITVVANESVICSGNTLNLTTSVVNAGSSPLYQWKKNGVNILGANGPSYSAISPLNGDAFVCQMTPNNSCQAVSLVNSNSLIANVQVPVQPSVQIEALNNNVCVGTQMIFNATALNGGINPSFVWYVAGVQQTETSSQFSSSNLSNGQTVYCTMMANNLCQLEGEVSSSVIVAQLFDPTMFYEDADYDGFGGTGSTVVSCDQPEGYSLLNTDCDDFNEFVFPGQFESCNHADDNCNGLIDEGVNVSSLTPTNAITKTYPTCSGTNLLQVNFAQGANSLITEGLGTDVWYKLNAAYNTLRAAYTGGTGENSIELYLEDNGCLILQQVENELGVSSEILLNDGLQVGSNYYVAVRNLSGGNINTGKVCFSHFLGSTCDHYYSNYTGVYDNSCRSFKAAFRANAGSYVFNVTNASSNGNALNITPWSYTTPNSSTTLTRIGTLLPANFSVQPITYGISIDARYALTDAVGNSTMLTAKCTQPCTATMSIEADLNLRATDRCPVYKSTSSTIATNRSICGASRYEWEFTKVLPVVGAPLYVIGGLSTTTLNMSTIPGISNGITYNVRVRAIHPNGGAGNWGTTACLRTTGAVGMALQEGSESSQMIGDLEHEVLLYPNPSLVNQFTIELPEELSEYSKVVVYDTQGKVVYSNEFIELSGRLEIDLPADLSVGMYMIELNTLKKRFTSRWLLE